MKLEYFKYEGTDFRPYCLMWGNVLVVECENYRDCVKIKGRLNKGTLLSVHKGMEFNPEWEDAHATSNGLFSLDLCFAAHEGCEGLEDALNECTGSVYIYKGVIKIE